MRSSELFRQVERELQRAEEPPAEDGPAAWAEWYERLGAAWSRYAAHTREGYGSACSAYMQAAERYRLTGQEEKARECDESAARMARMREAY